MRRLVGLTLFLNVWLQAGGEPLRSTPSSNPPIKKGYMVVALLTTPREDQSKMVVSAVAVKESFERGKLKRSKGSYHLFQDAL